MDFNTKNLYIDISEKKLVYKNKVGWKAKKWYDENNSKCYSIKQK